MADQDQAAAVAKEAEVVIPKRDEIPTPAITLNSVWGQTVIFGGQFVSPSFMSALNTILSAWDAYLIEQGSVPCHHGVHTIVFRNDGYPQSEAEKGRMVFGHALETTGSIAINLEHIFNKALEKAIDLPEDSAAVSSIYCNIWHYMMITILHELHHLMLRYNDPGVEVEIVEGEDEDAMADAFAESYAVFLAQNYPIEPGPLAEEPFFGPLLLQNLQDLSSGGDDAFVKKQQMMALKGILYWVTIKEEGKDDDEHIVKSWRQFMHWTGDDDAEDPKWAKVYAEPEKEEPAPAAPAAEATPAPAAAPTPAAAPAPGPTIEINAYSGIETEVPEVDAHLDAMVDMEAPADDGTSLMGGMMAMAQTMAGQPATGAPAPAPAPAAAPPWNPAPTPQGPTLMPNSSGMAHGLSDVQVGQVCLPVYQRLFSVLFDNCGFTGWKEGMNPPDAEGNVVSAGFVNMDACLAGMDFNDIPNFTSVFVEQSSIINGTWRKNVPIENGIVYGSKIDSVKMPKYDLYIINHEGHKERRTLLPQNMWKEVENANPRAYKSTAIDAQKGRRICYVLGPQKNIWDCRMILVQDLDSNGAYGPVQLLNNKWKPIA